MWVKGIMIKNVVTAEEDIPLQRAIEILYENHIGSLVILDNEKRCKGIFTTRDAIRAIAGKMDLQTPLREIMTRRVLTVPEDAPFAHARDLMIEHKIRHLPVTDKENRVVGIVTIRHIVDVLVGLPTVRN
jgi:CBS domain-containing protein